MSSAVQVHQDITKSGQRITRHLDAWRRYSDIWKTDKAGLLDKFKAKGPPCSAYEEKFSKFKKVRSRPEVGHLTGPAAWGRVRPPAP